MSHGNPVDTIGVVPHHDASYGMEPDRRDVAPGQSPVELRRVSVPARLTTPERVDAGTMGCCQYRQARRALVGRSYFSLKSSSAVRIVRRTTSCALCFSRAR